MQSESDEPTAAEDTTAEPVPMLEVTESGEVDFTEPPETTEGESPPQDTEPSEVRKHLITFRVNDMELEALNRRYAETSFRSRGDFCYELDEYHKAYKKLIELFPDGHIPKLSKLKTELEKARTDYAQQSAERTALKKEAVRLSRLARQKRDSQKTVQQYLQNEQAAKRKKGQHE